MTAVQVVEQDASQDKKAKRGGEAVELQKKKKKNNNTGISETSPGFQKQKEDDPGHCDPAWESQSHTAELRERQP